MRSPTTTRPVAIPTRALKVPAGPAALDRPPTALTIAKRLGGHPDAPISVIEKLFDKAPEVAAALFATGVPLDRAKLTERAE